MFPSSPQPLPLPPAGASKTAFRAWARQAAKERSTEQTSAISTGCMGHLGGIFAERGVNPAGNPVMLYVPIRGEIDPILLALSAINRNWPVCVGRGLSQTTPLQPVRIERSMVEGGFWHPELCDLDAWGVPVPRDHVPVRTATLAAVVVPGVAFDRRGHRLGRGAGVYDRFLATLAPTTLRIGVVPHLQLVPELPIEAHDIPMHLVVTEQEILRLSEPTEAR